DIGKKTAETIKTLNDTGLFNSDALSKASINTLTERGVVPGLEGAIDEVMGNVDNPVSDPTSNSANAE
ncbi:hypothetical protein, partial [Streptomyces sp. P17]|uniref:hypothetical protein n=1 Tax=Streptomyces sp. P17 TaxID=3074716 RepID=UPI0028F4479F